MEGIDVLATHKCLQFRTISFCFNLLANENKVQNYHQEFLGVLW